MSCGVNNWFYDGIGGGLYWGCMRVGVYWLFVGCGFGFISYDLVEFAYFLLCFFVGGGEVLS